MSFFRKFLLSLQSYGAAINFIHKHRLWKYLIVPAILNLLIFLALGIGVWEISSEMGEWLLHRWQVDSITGWLGGVLQWTIRIVVKVLSFFLYLKLYRYTVLIISAPGLAFLAEKTQEILTGKKNAFSVNQLVRDTLRGIGISLKNLLLELSLTIPLYLLAFVPVLTPLIGILIIGIESYFVGFSTIDYRNEFHRLSSRESRRFINQHRGLAVGNGFLFNLLLPVPVLGVLLMPPLSIVAAALAVEEVDKHQKGIGISNIQG